MKKGAKFTLTADIYEAAKGADVVITDVWASMGQEGEAEKRRIAFGGYQVSKELLSVAKKDVIFAALPAGA